MTFNIWKSYAGEEHSVAKLIIFRSHGVSIFHLSINTHKANSLGLPHNKSGYWAPLANKFNKYHTRFGNLPNDKLATEWLEEFQIEEKNTPIHLD